MRKPETRQEKIKFLKAEIEAASLLLESLALNQARSCPEECEGARDPALIALCKRLGC